MIEEKLELPLAGGATTEAMLYRPEGEGPWPGILHLTDIWGIRPPREEMARRQAAEGYVVLMPNLFWRDTRLPVIDFQPNFSEERTMKRLHELLAALTPQQMDEDAGLYLDYLQGLPQVKAGKLGVVGYCFSGQMAMRAAAVRPDLVAAAASFHGGGLYTDADTSPHRVLAKIKARLYFGHAENDSMMDAAAIAKLEAALAEWGGVFESETYPAAHGWTIKGPVHDEAQAHRAHGKLVTLFAETL